MTLLIHRILFVDDKIRQISPVALNMCSFSADAGDVHRTVEYPHGKLEAFPQGLLFSWNGVDMLEL